MELQGRSDGAPSGLRSRVPALKGRCPGPLDDGSIGDSFFFSPLINAETPVLAWSEVTHRG